MISAEGIQGKTWTSTSAINPNTSKATFRIKGDQQNQATSTYTFEYKKLSGDEPALSTCLVTVLKQ